MVFLPLLLVILPLAGVMLQGKPLAAYVEFPPLTVYVQHAPFSWVAFLLLGLLTVSVLVPLIRRFLRYTGPDPAPFIPKHPFPWWGYAGYLPFGLECMVVSLMFGRVIGEEGYN